ncbi:MAG: S-layer homology domain-containing protein, partial [Oscillospiraceae bacterium]|nr:S-layer homology domain-containing protein [Oscillospiraceae bacterium]
VYTKSFTDVKKSDWFYTYVMDLAETGVINGFEEKIDGETIISYKPQDNVTYAQALKLILLAVGYDEPAKTGKHWASGYLELAIKENLVTNVLTEARLDDQISRNMIAQIASHAMDLPKSTRTESPLKDVSMDSVYAPYILSLYDAGIINGDENGNYNGTKKITRAEMATIVWRINNYEG